MKIREEARCMTILTGSALQVLFFYMSVMLASLSFFFFFLPRSLILALRQTDRQITCFLLPRVETLIPT